MNLRQVRKKIKTIGNVSKITKAMQMVAAVKMRRAQQEAIEGREYRNALDMMAKKVITEDYAFKNSRMKMSNEKNLYIVISSDKGLCGNFNVNLFRFLSDQTTFDNDDFISIGKKGVEFILRTRSSIIADFSDQQPLVNVISPVFSLIFEKFMNNAYKSIFLVYNKFISTFKKEPTKVQLLPIQNITVNHTEKKSENQKYVIEPSSRILLESLLQDVSKEKIKTALLDSIASEHASRMMAMKNATDSAQDIMYNLTRLSNKLRQQGITYELLDMITAKGSNDIN